MQIASEVLSTISVSADHLQNARAFLKHSAEHLLN